MDWSNFSFNGVSGLSLVTERGELDPHWWPELQIDNQHGDGSNRNLVTNLGLGPEKISGKIHCQTEATITALMGAQGKGTLDGRTVVLRVTGQPAVTLLGDAMEAWIPVEFLKVG